MLENFNGKYGTLNDDQKDVLKEFINSVDNTPRLKEFYNGKVFDLKEKLNKILPNIENKATQIKLNEVTNLLSPLSKTSNVSDDDLINLLQYCELLEEIKKSNGNR